MKTIIKAFKFRLKISKENEKHILQFAGCCRFVWNKILKLNEFRLENKYKIIRYQEMSFWLTKWKQSEEYSFLAECHSQLLQQKLKDLDKAYSDAFDKKQKLKRMPRIRKKGLHDSFRYPQGFKIDNRRIFLPKIGWINFFKSQEIDGLPKNVTVIRNGKHWFISVQVEFEISDPVPKTNAIIGIDLGVKKFAAMSNGSYIEPENNFRKLESKLAKEQQKLSRKIKFTKNWNKQKKKVEAVHKRIANKRNDFLQKQSTILSKNHAVVFVEALKITNMTRSATGTIESPGRKVYAKSGLNKSILDQGWGKFKNQLKYKLDWHGGRLVEIAPNYTSQKCYSCGYIDKLNRTKQEKFCCVRCGYEENADINAAKNILAAGHAVLVCEANLGRDRQQKPLGMSDLTPAFNWVFTC